MLSVEERAECMNNSCTADIPNACYANSHPDVRISSKRFEQSPYAPRYIKQDALFGCYCNRFYPLSFGEDVVAQYWQLRQGVLLFDVPEKPLSIQGSDALKLLELVFTRKISTLKLNRARYAIACTPQGGVVMDGVLIRLREDHFWYVHANGEFESWLLSFSDGMDVEITDPNSRVLQIQGPKSLELFNALHDGSSSKKLGYFHAGLFDIGGQEVLVSRTGWTGELGIEVYSNNKTDHLRLWDYIFDVGESFNLVNASLESMGVRRIEAGILDYGTDFSKAMTPFATGLGMFVDLDKSGFVGRDNLMGAEKHCRLFGIQCPSIAPNAGHKILSDGMVVGEVTVGVWSPTLNTGIAYVVFEDALDGKLSWLGKSLKLLDTNNNLHGCLVVKLPFFDIEKKIPRGL